MTRPSAKLLQFPLAPTAPRGMVATVIGPPESGKSRLLWQLYTRHAPRKVTLEVVDETLALDPSALRVFGFDATLAALRDCADRASWHVVASLDREEVERFYALLCPELRSARTRSFALAVGGLVVACGELAHPAPVGLGKSSTVHSAYLRYRHHWLSLYGATQHAPLCDPVTRLCADRCVFFNTPDDLAREAITRASSREIARRVGELPQYHSITAIKSLRRAYVLDAAYRVYEVIDYRGETLARRDAGQTVGTLAGVASSADRSGVRSPVAVAGSR